MKCNNIFFINRDFFMMIKINKSGGPILAGVLGSNKPVFDIIGDPINVAARLQTSDVPGKVQISKAIYDIVCDRNFNIEERGEIFLKVKVQQLLILFHILIQIILSLLILKVKLICDYIKYKNVKNSSNC